jgi:hypothetical protein
MRLRDPDELIDRNRLDRTGRAARRVLTLARMLD